jgi:hypothetical protein
VRSDERNPLSRNGCGLGMSGGVWCLVEEGQTWGMRELEEVECSRCLTLVSLLKVGMVDKEVAGSLGQVGGGGGVPATGA